MWISCLFRALLVFKFISRKARNKHEKHKMSHSYASHILFINNFINPHHPVRAPRPCQGPPTLGRSPDILVADECRLPI